MIGRGLTAPISQDKRQRIFELAEAMYQSIHAQLSVPKYEGLALGRGANLDTVDAPVTNRVWLMDRFAAIRKLNEEPARLKDIASIVNWTEPGPGGFYDDLGNPSRQPHLVSGETYAKDPMFLRSPMTGFSIRGMGSVERAGSELYALPSLLGHGHRRAVRLAGEAALRAAGSAGAVQGAR